MAASKELRLQSTAPDAPTASVVKIYADVSGTLQARGINGTIYPVGQQWTGTTAFSDVRGPLTATGTLTGVACYLPIVGPSGQMFVIPAFRRV